MQQEACLQGINVPDPPGAEPAGHRAAEPADTASTGGGPSLSGFLIQWLLSESEEQHEQRGAVAPLKPRDPERSGFVRFENDSPLDDSSGLETILEALSSMRTF